MEEVHVLILKREREKRKSGGREGERERTGRQMCYN